MRFHPKKGVTGAAAPYTTKTVAMFFLANINPDYFAIKILIFYSIKKANNLRQQSEQSI